MPSPSSTASSPQAEAPPESAFFGAPGAGRDRHGFDTQHVGLADTPAGNVGPVSDLPEPPPRRAEFPVLWPITSRWSDNDVYGHVNNVVHYSWFDTAVNGWLLSSVGTDIRRLPAIGVVAETGCRYLGELSFPDAITVGLAVARLGNSSVTYRLAVFGNDAEEPAALGRFVHVYVDEETRRPVSIPEEIRLALNRVRTD